MSTMKSRGAGGAMSYIIVIYGSVSFSPTVLVYGTRSVRQTIPFRMTMPGLLCRILLLHAGRYFQNRPETLLQEACVTQKP